MPPPCSPTTPPSSTPISIGCVQLAPQVPEHIDGLRIAGHGADIFTDPRLTDSRSYPDELFRKPGEKQPNRAAFGAWASWVNATAKRDYGRPLFIAASADLADSTALAGLRQGLRRPARATGGTSADTNPRGALLPTEITEFTNAGMIVGLATVNLASDPFTSFNGFWGACSTYGSFSYLKYGEMRLFSQLAQDCELKVGKVLWVAGHSGPETAEDSRTHFGIYEPGVTQLFPEGKVIDLHPWEFNEVPVVLARRAGDRRADRRAPPHATGDRAARSRGARHAEPLRGGARRVRAAPLPRPTVPAMGTVFVQGTTSTANLVKALPELDARGST